MSGTVLDLFSGVGMYAKGMEDAGHEIIGFCEKDKFCQKILKKHWKTKPISWCIKSLNRALILSQAAHRVRIIVLRIHPEKVSMEKVQDSCGKWCEPFAWFDQKSGCWRTFQKSLDGGWAELLGAWPPAGMTVSGIAYQRTPLVRHTSVLESMLLPTLTANEGKGSGRNRYRNSPNFRGAKMSEGLRTCLEDPIYTHPNFAEAAMGLEKDWTLLETETRPQQCELSGKD